MPDRREAKRLRAKGMSWTTIGRTLGISRQTARRWAQGQYGRGYQADASRSRKALSATARRKRLQAIQWRAQGMPASVIAVRLGCTRQNVYLWLKTAPQPIGRPPKGRPLSDEETQP